MDQENQQMEQHPTQCRNGCGFYSNAGTEGLCSVCYKDMIKKKNQTPSSSSSSSASSSPAMASLSIQDQQQHQQQQQQQESLETASPTVILPASSSLLDKNEAASEGAAGGSSSSSDLLAKVGAGECSSPSVSVNPEEEMKLDSGKKKKNRCLSCKKKVGLTGFTCRCGGLFCSIHRYSDKHDCNFDYKELGQEEIRKSNPVVVAKKVQQI